MRLQNNPYLPSNGKDAPLIRQLDSLLREIITQINQLSEGQVVAVNNAAAAAPTGTAVNYVQGDFVLNSAPAVLGSPGGQYIVHGFRCVASGAPGTWVQVRTLTGT